MAKNAPERQKWLQLSIGVVNARWLSLWAEEIVRTGSGVDSQKLNILLKVLSGELCANFGGPAGGARTLTGAEPPGQGEKEQKLPINFCESFISANCAV